MPTKYILIFISGVSDDMAWFLTACTVYASQWVFCLEAGVELVQHGHTEACVLEIFLQGDITDCARDDGVTGVDGTPNLEKPEHAS